MIINENTVTIDEMRRVLHVVYKRHSRIGGVDLEAAARQLAICQRYCEDFLKMEEGEKGKGE